MKHVALAIGTFLHTIIYGPLGAVGYTHPVHPILVHLTIGPIVAGFFFDYIAWIARKPSLYTAARYNLVFSFPAFVLTGCAGLADWSARYQVVSLNPAGNPVMFAFGIKFILAGALLLLFVAAYFVFRRTSQSHPARHLLYLLFLLDVVGLGFYGGNIIYG